MKFDSALILDLKVEMFMIDYGEVDALEKSEKKQAPAPEVPKAPKDVLDKKAA